MVERWTPKLKKSLTKEGLELRMWTDKDGEYVLYVDYVAHRKNENTLLDAVKAAYLKHHCNSDIIGWDELSSILLNALCITMGEKGYQDWHDSVVR